MVAFETPAFRTVHFTLQHKQVPSLANSLIISRPTQIGLDIGGLGGYNSLKGGKSNATTTEFNV